MLQQTQVATVIPYFERFMAAFPNVTALARARETQVLRLWEGLGYYRRAHHLHQAARQIVKKHAGHIPQDPQILSTLPGLGRYSVGAILSQAFDQPFPILEVNSRRVLCRLLGNVPAPKKLWELAAAFVPVHNAGEFNQALMELGALICTTRQPRCGHCPLARNCQAQKLGNQENLPPPKNSRKKVLVAELAVVVRKDTRILLVQRPDHGRWASLWEFPHGPCLNGEPLPQAANRLLLELTGLRGEPGECLATLRHAVTHYRITLSCLEARYRAGRFRSDFYQQARWIDPQSLSRFPVSSPQRKIADFLRNLRKK